MGERYNEGRRVGMDTDMIIGAVLAVVVAFLKIFNSRTIDFETRIADLEKALMKCLDKIT